QASVTYFGDGLSLFIFFFAAGVLSVILLMAGACQGFRTTVPPQAASVASWMSAAMAGYAVLVMAWDPFVWIGDEELNALIGIAVILPLLLYLKPLVGSHSWLAICGVALFSAACIACLLFNCKELHTGVGFWQGWVE